MLCRKKMDHVSNSRIPSVSGDAPPTIPQKSSKIANKGRHNRPKFNPKPGNRNRSIDDASQDADPKNLPPSKRHKPTPTTTGPRTSIPPIGASLGFISSAQPLANHKIIQPPILSPSDGYNHSKVVEKLLLSSINDNLPSWLTDISQRKIPYNYLFKTLIYI